MCMCWSLVQCSVSSPPPRAPCMLTNVRVQSNRQGWCCALKHGPTRNACALPLLPFVGQPLDCQNNGHCAVAVAPPASPTSPATITLTCVCRPGFAPPDCSPSVSPSGGGGFTGWMKAAAWHRVVVSLSIALVLSLPFAAFVVSAFRKRRERHRGRAQTASTVGDGDAETGARGEG